jgi:hypothetical protein
MVLDLGLTGLGILVAISIAFGLAAQLFASAGNRWMWLIAAAGWFVGGLVASEVIWGTLTVDDIQPIVDGLAFDESLLGGLIGGLAAVVVARLLMRGGTFHRPMSA